MINQFPSSERPYKQINRGDSVGSLWASKNLDLQSNYGVMRLAPRLKINTSATDDADFGLPVAIIQNADNYFAACGTRIFTTYDGAGGGSNPNDAFTEDTSTGAPTNLGSYSDLGNFNGRLWVTTNTALLSQTTPGGSWTSRDTITSTSENPMTYFANVPGGRLYYVSAAGIISSISDADVVADPPNDYAIDVDQTIACLRATSNDIWIGINDKSDDEAKGFLVGRWNGISPQLSNFYIVNSASKVNSMVILNDIPYIIDSNGILSKFNGNAFEEVGRIPFYGMSPGTNFCRKNSMCITKNGTILVNVYNSSLATQSGATPDFIYEGTPSGVWEWSEDFGFVHKYSFSYTTRTSSTITDYGQYNIVSNGALYNCEPFIDGQTGENGRILVGATIYTNASSTLAGIWFDDSNDTLIKKGSFVTTWFDSVQIQDKWERLWGVYKRLLSATDSIVFKYRIAEENPLQGVTITWVNTTSFTTTDANIVNYAPTATGFNGTQGGEVEITQGVGAGLCAHITSVVNNAGTYTVTIDETATGATTTTAKAQFQKWIKLNPAQAQNQIKQYSQYGIGASSPGIQIKCCLTFTGEDEFIKMALASNEDIIITT